MMNPLIGASVATSFIAGGAALFAPCCIGVLLPTYLGSVFRQRTKVFFMTFVYFLGLLAVFLPIGLGFSLISVVLSQYHNLLFSVGAVFMILLGIFLLSGKHFSWPSPVHPQVSKYTLASIFVLGIFSAIATTCCAPVLAGVLAISTLAGSLALGGLYTLSYVLGMVFPLFLVAAFLDKTNITKKLWIFRRSSHLIAGSIFVLFGSYVFYLAQTNQLQIRSDAQFQATLWLAGVNRTVSGLIGPAGESLGAVLVVTATLLIIFIAIKQFREGRWKL